MASIDRSDPIILGHVLAEHHDLFNRMCAVRHAFAAERRPEPEQAPALTECLRSLRDHLESHFRQEERGGFLEEAVARMPRLHASVTALIAEHPALMNELDTIIGGLPSSLESVEAWHQAGRAFETFATNMLAHERNENAVVQEGYNEDLGLLD